MYRVCPNPECPDRLLTGKQQEFLNTISHCSACGVLLVDAATSQPETHSLSTREAIGRFLRAIFSGSRPQGCETCGRPVVSGARFCGECGGVQDISTSKIPTEPPSRRRPPRLRSCSSHLSPRRTEAYQQAALNLGMSFVMEDEDLSERVLFALFQRGYGQSGRDLIKRDIAGSEVILFAYRYQTGADAPTNYDQPVAAFRQPS